MGKVVAIVVFCVHVSPFPAVFDGWKEIVDEVSI
jgi:hypothetical protein